MKHKKNNLDNWSFYPYLKEFIDMLKSFHIEWLLISEAFQAQDVTRILIKKLLKYHYLKTILNIFI